MSEIKFSEFSCMPGRIEFNCQEIAGGGITQDRIYFEIDNRVLPDNDAIAYAISSLCGTAYDEISLDLPVTRNAICNIENFTKAVIHAEILSGELDTKEKKKETTILNFSGGFDSLAALHLLPVDVKLVSIDFGGWFEREKIFFEQFHPYILRTNFRQVINADKNSWTFMGAGAILYSGYLNASYNVFGTILEAAFGQLQVTPSAAQNAVTPPFSYLGLKDIRCMNGLTEAGTAMVVSCYSPDLANASLESLSDAGTVKRYRKEMLLEIICEKYGRKIVFHKTQPPKPEQRILFGKSLTEDFLCFYILKYRGRDTVEKMFLGIPEDVYKLSKKLKLRFYERLNCAFLDGSTFPNDEFKAEYMKKLIMAGIMPYEEEDYCEYRTVVDFLRRFHGSHSNAANANSIRDSQNRKEKLLEKLFVKMSHKA